MLRPHGPVHTVRNGSAWANMHDGHLLSRHHERSVAVTAGFEIARILEVEHVIHREEPATTEPPSHDTPPG